MIAIKHWSVDVLIGEIDDRTHAEARLHTDDMHLRGTGDARLSPHDDAVPAIGDELAAARALADLGHQLLQKAAADTDRGPAGIHGR
jgi:hypothetical protein